MVGCVTNPFVELNEKQFPTAEEYRVNLVKRLMNQNDKYMVLPTAVRKPNGDEVNLATMSDEGVYGELRRLDNAIYGLTDDRTDVYEIINREILLNTEGVASLWPGWRVQKTWRGTYNLSTSEYGESMNLHDDEPFFSQPVGAFCTAFLVEKDIIVTAGHCCEEWNVESAKIVFGFQMKDSRKAITSIPEKDVFSVIEVIARKKTSDGLDYAVLRLDRPCNRPKLKLSKYDVAKGDRVYVIGHPVGLPLKVAGNAKVGDVSDKYEFKAYLDTYGGNSGSPVFNDKNEVVGILVRGAQDFIWVNGKRRSMRIPTLTQKYYGEGVTKVSVFKQLIP